MTKNKSAAGVNGPLYRVNRAFDNSKIISSIHKGFIVVIPVFLIGSVALIIMNFPVQAVRDFVAVAAGGRIGSFFNFVYQATFGVCSLYIVLAVAYKYSQRFLDSLTFNILSGFVAVASYIAALGLTDLNNVSLAYTNVQSVFSALLCAILATRLFVFLCELLLKRRWFSNLSPDMAFGNVLRAVLPMMLTISVFALVPIVLEALAGTANFNDLFVKLASMPFESMGRGYFSALLLVVLQTLFWFFGIHGSNVFETVVTTLFADIPGQIVTKTFLDSFALIGGCGSLICLAVAMLLFSRIKRRRLLCKTSLPLMLFNINEVMIFGLPIVLNPFMLAPFILTPVVMLSISYGAVALGLVPAPIASVHWTTPIFINGYLATDSVMGIVLQVVLIAVGVAIYAPFVRLSENYYVNNQERMIRRLTDAIRDSEKTGTSPVLFKGDDELSRTAKEISLQLISDIKKGKVEVYYQPIVDDEGRVAGAEALLRWKYLTDGFLYPPLILALATEAEFFETLSAYIRDRVISDISKLNEIAPGVKVSLNIRSRQLEDSGFIDRLIAKADEAHLKKGALYLEITEENKLKDNDNTRESFEKLSAGNIACAIDDFSMGHTSLKYLQTCNFRYVKLDGALIGDMLKNSRSRNIVRSIINLGKKLDFDVIAEYVETEEQMRRLKSMGCCYYQGYLYSPAVTFDELREFIAGRGAAGEDLA